MVINHHLETFAVKKSNVGENYSETQNHHSNDALETI